MTLTAVNKTIYNIVKVLVRKLFKNKNKNNKKFKHRYLRVYHPWGTQRLKVESSTHIVTNHEQFFWATCVQLLVKKESAT